MPTTSGNLLPAIGSSAKNGLTVKNESGTSKKKGVSLSSGVWDFFRKFFLCLFAAWLLPRFSFEQLS